jgi:hypothetical protein
MQAQKGSSGMNVDVFNLGARWGWVVNSTPHLQSFGSRKEIAGRTPRPVWTSVERRISILYKEPTRCNFGSIVY